MSDPTDPADEVARTWGAAMSATWLAPRELPVDRRNEYDRVIAALQPVRNLHKPRELRESVFNGDGTWIGQRVKAVVCDHCYGGPHQSTCCDGCTDDTCEGTYGPFTQYQWPCATARAVYSEEELR